MSLLLQRRRGAPGLITPSGVYLFPDGVVGAWAGQANAIALNWEFAVPFTVGQGSLSLTRIGMGISAAGAAGSVVRLGIREAAADGTPGTLLVDAGTIDGTVAAFHELAIAETLTQGLYWLTATAQVAVPSIYASPLKNGILLPFLNANPFSDGVLAYYQQAVGGALPAGFAFVGSQGGGYIPGIAVKVA